MKIKVEKSHHQKFVFSNNKRVITRDYLLFILDI